MVEGRLEVLALRTVVVMRLTMPLTVRLLMAMDQSIVVPRFFDLVNVQRRHQRKTGNTKSHDSTHNPDGKH